MQPDRASDTIDLEFINRNLYAVCKALGSTSIEWEISWKKNFFFGSLKIINLAWR